jgi:hypothetical protein
MAKRHYKVKPSKVAKFKPKKRFSFGRIIAIVLAVVVISTMILGILLPALLYR